MLTNFYVDLDSIMDTRAGLLRLMYSEQIEDFLNSDTYRMRLHDNFGALCPLVDQSLFTKAWQQRDNQVLFRSVMTDFIDNLKAEVRELFTLKATGMEVTTISLTINTYPYKLEESGLTGIRNMFTEIVGFESVNVVSVLPDFLTPAFLSKFESITIYDLDQWLNFHIEALSQTPLFGRRFVCPIRLIKVPDNFTEIPNIIEEVKEKLAPFFQYEPEPMNIFSFSQEKE